MPATIVTGPLTVPPFAIIGGFGPCLNDVGHVGLLVEPGVVVPGAEVELIEEGPPTRAGQLVDGFPSHGRMKPDVVGWTDLDANQIKLILSVLSDIRTRSPQKRLFKPFDCYVVLPSFEVPGEVPGSTKYWRFSCAGLVYYCYSQGAHIDLVDIARLPQVAEDTLARVWPNIVGAGPALRRYLGLDAPAPWPILLPGYLLHSLARDDISVPYVAQAEDIAFPRPDSRTPAPP